VSLPQIVVDECDESTASLDSIAGQETELLTVHPPLSTPDNKLVLRAFAEPSHPDPERRYTSARLVSKETLSRDRGCLSAELLLPCADGIWPAFWLLPREPFAWPGDGEVDVAETWNGDHENKSCLHWGLHGAEPQKHRTMGTPIPDMHTRPVRFDWAWEQQPGPDQAGRMLWWIDGRPVMRAQIPEGTRPLRDWNVLLNVAMGGNVCQGKTPVEGQYDMVVHSLYLASEPQGGWGRFESDWHRAADGRTG